MLQLLNSNKERVSYFKNYKDLCIESVLSTGDSTLSFLYPLNARWNEQLIEEAYIRNKLNEYVIKSRRINNDNIEIICNLNLEDLEGTPFDRYISEVQSITNALNLALVGTGWTVATNSITKKRTVRKTCCSSYDIIQEIKKIYRVDIVFDTLNKKVYVYEELGEDRGAYAIEKLNLTSLSVESDSYNYFTRIIPEGKDGLTIESINSGKKYVENYQYTNKVKTFYWKDERYTVVESLKEDAIAKLEELSKPYRSYSGEIKNLAKINKKYSILEFGLGDTITLISKNKKVKDKQRIVKITEYPADHTKDTFEIANLSLRFEDQQDRFEEAADIIDNVTTDDGTIDGDAIDEVTTDKIKDFDVEVGKVANLEVLNAKINNLEVNKASIQSLVAVEAKIGILEATKANITDLTATNATIENLKVNKADITDLNAVSIKVGILEGDFANIQDIVSGNISSDNIQSGGITGDRLNMNTVFINDANIINVNASKINAGEIDTSKIKIKSSDGAIEIAGATQQFKDKNNKVRIQMGQDAKGEFNFILRGEDGTTTLIDHKGIKEKAIADDLIKENMVAENAIGEKAINYNSFSSGFNKDTNTTQLKATKIRLDNQNQTLDVAFTSLKNQADGTKTQTESNSTSISVQQGQINTAIANTVIVKDGQEILLKDDYNTTVATVNSMKSTISSHTTKIDENTGKITTVESKTNTIERDLGSITARVGSVELNVTNNTNQLNEVITNTEIKFAEIKTTTENINQSVQKITEDVLNIDGEVKEKITLSQAKAEIDIKANEIMSSVSTTSTGNLITNGGFETGDWSYWSQNLDARLFMADGYGGGKCLGIDSSSGVGKGVYQFFATVPGKVYSVSFYGWLSHGSASCAAEGCDKVYFDDSTVNKWGRMTLTFKAVKNSTAITFYSEHSNRSAFYIDNIMVNEGSIPLEFTEKSASHSYVEQQMSSSSIITKVQSAMNNGHDIHSAIMSFSLDGLIVESPGTNTKTNMTDGGFRILRKDNGQVLFEARDGRLYINGHFASDETIQANGGIYTRQAIRGTGNTFVAVASNGIAVLRSDVSNVYLQTVDEVKVTGPSDPNNYKNIRAHNVLANNKLYQAGKPVAYNLMTNEEKSDYINAILDANIYKDCDGSLTTNYYIHSIINEDTTKEENLIDIGTQISMLILCIRQQKQEILELRNILSNLNK